MRALPDLLPSSRFARGLFGLALLGPVLLFLGLGAMQWQRVTDAEQARSARVLDLAQTQVGALVEADRLMLDRVRDHLARPGPLVWADLVRAPALAAYLRARAREVPQIGAVFLADSAGVVRLLAGPGGLAVLPGDLPSLQDRAAFAAARHGAALAIGGPCPAPAGGRAGLTAVEPLTDEGGRFLGVVGACDPLRPLRRAWMRRLHPGERLALLRSDGRLLARVPDAAASALAGAAEPAAWPPEAMRPVPGAPLRVGYAPAADATLQAWYPAALRFAGLALVAGLVPLAAAGAARRRQVAALAAAEQAEWRAAALSAGAASVRRLYERTPAPLFALGADGRIVAVSDRWLALFGCRRDEVLGRRFDLAVPHALRPTIAEAWAALAGGAPRAEVAGPLPGSDGAAAPMLLSLQAERAADGTLVRGLAVLTEAPAPPAEGPPGRADAAIDGLAAVGQITGGVAHDFNNLLMVVMGSLERLATHAENPEMVRRLAGMAMAAAERGSRLTGQLLAYSRRQPLRPELVNANRLVREAAGEIEAVAGPRIEVQWLLSPVLDPARLDPVQFRAVLLALVANAREAMTQGGRLSIETRNIAPGDAVREIARETARHTARATYTPATGGAILVAVSDTGCGMSEAMLARACEPFFTTKPPGRGSGLGLSMVQGFVFQSGGWMELASEPGVGTTVRLFLPAVDEPAAATEAEMDAADPGAAFGSGSPTGSPPGAADEAPDTAPDDPTGGPAVPRADSGAAFGAPIWAAGGAGGRRAGTSGEGAGRAADPFPGGPSPSPPSGRRPD